MGTSNLVITKRLTRGGAGKLVHHEAVEIVAEEEAGEQE
jgi:hypothetical protein